MLKVKNKNRTQLKFNNDGFTIVELLVGINLSFIVITILISLFLFSTRFIASSIKNIEDKTFLSIQLNSISNLLNHTESFIISSDGSNIRLLSDTNFGLQFDTNKIMILPNDSLSNISEYEVLLYLKNGDSIKIKNGKIESYLMFSNNEFSVTQNELVSFTLNVLSKGKSYPLFYAPKKISINHFTNITETNE